MPHEESVPRLPQSPLGLDAKDFMRAVSQNAPPAIGVVFLGWSAPLILLLYWLENLIGSILFNRLIRRHEAATHLRGHYRRQLGGGRGSARLASEHAGNTVGFTLMHGVFLFVSLLLVQDGAALLDDVVWVLIACVGVVVVAVRQVQPLQIGLEQRSFAWLRERAKISEWPVISMHVGLLLGFAALTMPDGGMALAVLFIGLRIGLDLARAYADKNPAKDPPEPPPPLPLSAKTAWAMMQHDIKVQAYEAALRDEEFCPPEERDWRGPYR